MDALDNGEMVGALLVDLSKAFDSVTHQKLVNQLLDINCCSSSLNWFISFLSDRMQRVTSGKTVKPLLPVKIYTLESFKVAV